MVSGNEFKVAIVRYVATRACWEPLGVFRTKSGAAKKVRLFQQCDPTSEFYVVRVVAGNVPEPALPSKVRRVQT